MCLSKSYDIITCDIIIYKKCALVKTEHFLFQAEHKIEIMLIPFSQHIKFYPIRDDNI